MSLSPVRTIQWQHTVTGSSKRKDKVIKKFKRSPRACTRCRSRKVRCDVSSNGQPCSRCVFAKGACYVIDLRRHARPKKSTICTSPIDDLRSTANPIQPAGGSECCSESTQIDSYARLFTPPLDTQSSFVVDKRNSLEIPLPTSSLSPRLGPDERRYLEKKGAFSIPPKPLRDQLIQSYIDYVHWEVPALSLWKLMQFLDPGDGQTTVELSLLLLQAILFAGAAHVPIQHLHAAGFTSRIHAQSVLFDRAKLLYRFDCETNLISVVHSLVLIAHGCTSSKNDEEHDQSHWLGLAVSLCYGCKLNRWPTTGLPSSDASRLWKRTWWSCCVLDQTTAWRLHQHPQIHQQDFDVPMIDVDDFELNHFKDGRIRAHMYRLAAMYVNNATLCSRLYFMTLPPGVMSAPRTDPSDFSSSAVECPNVDQSPVSISSHHQQNSSNSPQHCSPDLSHSGDTSDQLEESRYDQFFLSLDGTDDLGWEQGLAWIGSA